ncbi:uncharacterized protein LOC114327943 [Diabrotica virgifera virgifera]|uniref:Uncharacterized protein LOC114327943 n=1 Tax=Diabrotica virgifera virgifera TaxID=50390 RepID=A0A6P7FCB6_DIAVI|nr:uncharacterized protein LOC114327943 [Diabrotica virgifera virgifera]
MSTFTVVFLLLFVSFYVISLSTYTYITSLPHLSNNTISRENKIRVKRIASNDYQLKDEVLMTNLNTINNIDYSNGTTKPNIPNTIPTEKMVTLNKCCADNQYLNPNYECQDGDEDISSEELLNKISDYFENASTERNYINQNTVNLKYNYILRLRNEHAFALIWPSSNTSQRYTFNRKELFLNEFIHINKTRLVTSFSPQSFCVDILSSGGYLVTFVNPCIEKICIQKCCPKGFYYNIRDKLCVVDPAFTNNFEPTFHVENHKIQKQPQYYVLDKNFKCSDNAFMQKLQMERLDGSLYLQEDGSLMTFQGAIQGDSYNMTDYCIDQVYDGNSENAVIGGFICQLIKENPERLKLNQTLSLEPRLRKQQKLDDLKILSSCCNIPTVIVIELIGCLLAAIFFLN